MGKKAKYSMQASISKLTQLLSLEKKDIYTIYWFAILAGLLGLSLPLGIQTIISFVQTNSLSASLAILILMVLVGTFFIGFLQVKQLQLLEKIKQKIFVRYSLEYSHRIPNMDAEKVDGYYLPELVNRFFDTVSLQKGLSKLLLDMPAAVIQIIFGIILLAFYNSVFIAFGIVLVLILFLILKITSNEGFQTAMAASHYKYNMGAWLQDMARGINSFKFARKTSLPTLKTDQILGKYLDARTGFFKVLLQQFWALIVFKLIITAAMLIVGAFLLLNNQMSVGQFVAAEIVIVSIISSVEKLIVNLDTVYDAIVSVEKLSQITEAEVEHSGTLPILAKNEGLAITFENVSYTYPGGQYAVNNVSFELNAGDMALFTGKSGSGKSTVLQLLTGALRSFTGKILINQVPLFNYNLATLRQHTGVLFSKQDIFQGTLYENITMGDANIDVDQINELANQLGLQQFLSANFDGMDTKIDPVGQKLPQKIIQSILILRALLGNYRLLILESPFDNFDGAKVEQIMSYLKTQKHTTTLITSSNENTLQCIGKYATKVIELDQK